MKKTPSSRRRVVAAAAAALGILLLFEAAPAAAQTMNPCAVQSGFQARKLKEGAPVTVSGLLTPGTEANGFTAEVSNDDKSCTVFIEGTDAQIDQLAACGAGAAVTISGKITEELFVPALVAEAFRCE